MHTLLCPPRYDSSAPLARVAPRRRRFASALCKPVSVASLLLGALGATFSSPARAAPNEQATLAYTTVSGCPNEASFRRKVAARLGYDPFVEKAARAVEIKFAVSGKRVSATTRLRMPTKPDSVRSLEEAPDHCEELSDAVAAGVAVAIDPVRASAPRGEVPAPVAEPPARAAEPAWGTPSLKEPVPAAPTGNSADATTEVKITSDWPDATLIRHLGTSSGTGYAGGRAVTITTVHLEKVCRLPCTANLPTEGDYAVDAPGMHARGFKLPVGNRSLDLRVEGANVAPLYVSSLAATLGGTTALLGGIFWAVLGTGTDYSGRPRDPSAWQTMTFVGAGVMVAGIIGLIYFPRTHVLSSDGVKLDARASRPPKLQFTGNGVVF